MEVDGNQINGMTQIHPILLIETPPIADNCRKISILGQIRQDAVACFKSRMIQIIEEDAPANLTLDFARVDFIDSQGLAVIYELFLLLKSGGRTFEIVNASANIANLFLLTRLHRLFTIR